MDTDRTWLLTWTTYGSWLPGDARGSVTSVRDRAPHRERHNRPQSPVDGPMPGLQVAAIMAHHCHVVLGVGGDPDPSLLLRDLKSYGSRALNRFAGTAQTWWTQSGSRRKLPDADAVERAVASVRHQSSPLAIWAQEMRP